MTDESRISRQRWYQFARTAEIAHRHPDAEMPLSSHGSRSFSWCRVKALQGLFNVLMDIEDAIQSQKAENFPGLAHKIRNLHFAFVRTNALEQGDNRANAGAINLFQLMQIEHDFVLSGRQQRIQIGTHSCDRSYIKTSYEMEDSN
jgi:hypothetical protein